MSYAGHVLDMINRIRYNNSLIESSRERYTRIRKSYDSVHIKHQVQLKTFREIPQDQLEQIKYEVRQKLKRERRIATVKTLVSTIAILTIIAVLVYKLLDSKEMLK